jgi:hypothetical protein
MYTNIHQYTYIISALGLRGLFSSHTPMERQAHPTLDTTALDQWYSTFFVRVPPDTISLQLCTPKVVVT